MFKANPNLFIRCDSHRITFERKEKGKQKNTK